MFVSKNNIKLESNLKTLRLDGGTLRMRRLRSFKEKIAIEARWELDGGTGVMWNTMVEQIRQITNGVLGVSKERGPISKETWWWNDEVQTIVKAKKEVLSRGRGIGMRTTLENISKHVRNPRKPLERRNGKHMRTFILG